LQKEKTETDDGLYGSEDSLGKFLSNWRTNIVLKHTKGKLVDLACGDNRLVKKYGGGIGVDIEDYGSVDIVTNDFTKLPIESESVDTVSIIASLNIFTDRINSLKEINRILKSDGQLLVTMPNPPVLKLWYKFRKPPWELVPGFTDKQLNEMLAKANLTVHKKKRFMLFLNQLFVIKKLK